LLGFINLQCVVTLPTGFLPVWSVWKGDLFAAPSLEILTSKRIAMGCSVVFFFWSATATSRLKIHQPTAQQNHGSPRDNWGPTALLHWIQELLLPLIDVIRSNSQLCVLNLAEQIVEHAFPRVSYPLQY